MHDFNSVAIIPDQTVQIISVMHNYCTQDFNPNFAPVIPNKAVFKDESLSVKSTIVPLEKWDKPCDDNMIDESAKCYQAQNFEEPDCTNSQDFNPNFAPVIPNEPVFKDETSSVKSIIVLLEKWDKPCDDMMINESAKSYQALKFKIVKENGCSIV